MQELLNRLTTSDILRLLKEDLREAICAVKSYASLVQAGDAMYPGLDKSTLKSIANVALTHALLLASQIDVLGGDASDILQSDCSCDGKPGTVQRVLTYETAAADRYRQRASQCAQLELHSVAANLTSMAASAQPT